MSNIINPPNPYVGTLRIFPGTLVKITGQPRPNAQRFAINFQTGPSLNPRDDLAFHLSPCFNPPRIVRNSLRHGAWGVEESWSNGQTMLHTHPFEIIILAEADKFKIAINGNHYADFNHRIPYPEITHLTIDGDVNISMIDVSTSSMTQQPAYNQYGGAPSAPYPSAPTAMPMPMPTPTHQLYPTLPGYPSQQANMPTPYPTATGPTPPYPAGSAGPVPLGASYSSGPPGYPSQQPMPPHNVGYPPPMGHGPAATGAQYQGYPVSRELFMLACNHC